MMNDVFKEQLIKVKPSSTTGIKKVGIIVGAVVIGIAGLIFAGGIMGPLLIVGLVIGATHLVKGMNLEYEYILTNNELDIDKIINKERRKRCFTIDLKSINLMAHVDNGMKKAELDEAKETIDVSGGEKGPNTYAILFMHEDTLTKMIFEPNDDLKQLIFRQAPSKIFL